MHNETITKEYEGKIIRYTDENGKFYYSIVDLVAILTNSKRPRKYWYDIKGMIKKNDRQLSLKIGKLKLKAKDGKYYLTDVIEEVNLRSLINAIPSQRKEKFIKWINDITKKQIIPYNEQIINNLIYEIRGVQVMLDSDLANLYCFSQGTKALNQAVKRNIERFPKDFYFQLTKKEYMLLQSQLVTTVKNRLPYVFTEQGVAMLATILRTSVASAISVNIMRSFAIMRKYVANELIEQKYINNQVFKNTEDLKNLQEAFKKLEEKKVNNEIYFNGQIYDAYSKIMDIFKRAKKELIIIDGYADKSVLDMIKNIHLPVTLICKNNCLLKPLDIKKYKVQYHNLTVKYDKTFHDRYFILDQETVYHCGASLNRIGYKTFSINLLLDIDIKNSLLKKIKMNN